MATVNEKMTAIADAIRDKTGGTSELTLDGMAEEISNVYEAGKQAQYDEFWDNFQNYGNRTDYNYGFYSTLQENAGWNDVTFKPKYDIKPAGVTQSIFWRSNVTDFTKCGVDIDLSKCTDLAYAFYSCMRATHIGVVDASNCKTLYTTQGMFDYNVKMETVDKLILNNEGETAMNIFTDCSALQNIVIEGVIGRNLVLKACSKLTYESLMSFINALKDFAGTNTTRTATLHATAKAKLTESDIAIATQKGWTVA